MNEIRKRPLAYIAVSFYLGSYCFAHMSSEAVIISLIISAVVAIFCMVMILLKCRKNESVLVMIISISIAVSAVISCVFIHFRFSGLNLDGTAECKIKCEVMEELSVSEYYSRYEVRITEIDGESVDLPTVLEVAGENLNSNNVILYRGTVDEIENSLISDDKLYYLSDGIFYYSTTDDIIEGYYDSSFSLEKYAKNINSKISASLINAMGDRNGGFAAAVSLGNKTSLDRGVRLDFTRLGISHLLAISGIHLTLIAYSVKRLLEKLTQSHIVSNIICICVIGAYCVLTGFPVSVCRAAFMMLIACIGALFSRKTDMLTSLGISVMLIVLINPYAAADLSLMLSFSSILGCIAFQSIAGVFKFERIKRKTIRKAISYIVSSIAISVIVLITTFPAVLSGFDEFSIISPLTNLVYIPLVSLALLATLILILLRPVPVLFDAFAKVASALISLILDSADYVSRMHDITVSTHYKGFFVVLILFAVSLFLVRHKRLRAKIIAFSLCLLAAVGFVLVSGNITYNDPAVYVVNHSKNESLVLAAENKVMICDISDGSYGIAHESVNAMREATYCEIDTYLLTHYHVRHAATLRKLCDRVIIRNIVLPLPISESDFKAFDEICAVAEENGCSISTFDREGAETLYFHGYTVDLTEYIKLSRSTHPVVAFSISGDHKSVSYLGASHIDDKITAPLDKFKSCDFVILGVHGPIYKSELVREEYITENLYYNKLLVESAIFDPHRKDTPFSDDAYIKIPLT